MGVVLIALGGEDELEGSAAQLLIAPGAALLGDVLAVLQGVEGVLHLAVGHQSQGVQHQVGHLVALVHEEHHLVAALRPGAVEQVVIVRDLPGDERAVLPAHQLLPDVHALIHGAEGAEIAGVVAAVHDGHGLLHEAHDVAFDNLAVGILIINVKGEVIAVADGGKLRDLVAVLLQPRLEGLQVVGHRLGVEHGVHQVEHDGGGVDPVQGAFRLCLLFRAHQGGEHGGHVDALRLDGDGVA